MNTIQHRFESRMPVRRFPLIVILVFAVSSVCSGALLNSTYLGGRGDERVESIAVDAEGNVYVCGSAKSKLVLGLGRFSGFPITEGAYNGDQPVLNPAVYVSKFNPDLSELLASTFVPFLGEDSLMVLDPGDGTVIVGGDGGLARFSADLKTLVDSISFRLVACDLYDMHLAADGSVLLTGSTTWDDFPVTTGAFDTTRNGTDGFVLKVDHAFNRIEAATLIGGALSDVLYGIETDSSGNIYVAGFSDSGWGTTEPYPTTTGALIEQLPEPGYTAAVVTRFDPNLSTVLSSTYLGGSDKDRAYEIEVDESGRVYVAGTTVSPDFPTTEGAFDREPDPTINYYDGEIFVSRLDEDLTTLQASTFFGTPGTQATTAMELDGDGITIAGISHAYEEQLPMTPGAYLEEPPEGTYPAFVSRFDADLTELRVSTLIVASDLLALWGLAFGASDEVYLAGTSEAWDVPIVPGGFDTSYNGGGIGDDGFVMRFTGDLLRYQADGHEIRGRVTVNGVPLSGVHVELEGPHGGVATTDTNGEFVFLSRPDGDYHLRIEREYYGFSEPEQQVSVSGSDLQVPDFQGTLSSIFGWVDMSSSLKGAGSTCGALDYTDYSDVFFLDREEGWVTSSCAPEIYHTTDGGRTWEVQAVREACHAVHMLDALNGYAGGTGGIVFRTFDGGATWNLHGSTGRLLNMDFPPGGEIGCSSGGSGNFWWITPEGVTRVNTGSSSTLSGVSYPKIGNEAWVVGGNRIYRVSDQGIDSLAGPSGTFNNISLIADGEAVSGWVVGDYGLIGHTGDGTGWLSQVNHDVRDRPLWGVHAFSPSEAWAVGPGIIHHTRDGGETWEIEGRSLPEQSLSSVFAVDSETVYAVGNKGAFFKYTRLEPPIAYTGPLTLTGLSRTPDPDVVTLTWEPATSQATLEFSSDLKIWQPLAEDLTGTSWTGAVPGGGCLRLRWEVLEP